MNAREKEQRRAFECEIKIKTKKIWKKNTRRRRRHDEEEGTSH